jgi:transcriptional activator of cad operon
MDRLTAIPLRIGAWCVDPKSGQMSRGGETVRVEARMLRLLLCLAERPGEVVSIEELLNQVWTGVVVTPDSVYQAIASLRRLLGDDPKQPTYIATVPRLGYRMVATVTPWVNEEPLVVPRGRMRGAWRTVVVALCAVLAGVLLFNSERNVHPPTVNAAQGRSVAVLPFLDLTTQSMSEEYFADGMTEELIDRLSKVPGLRVPSPTSSFYFKGKRATVADIAMSLGVAYVLDGSVRQSETTLRVAARLVRAADGYVAWSETYDRPIGDKLWIQDDIASEVTKALRVAIH